MPVLLETLASPELFVYAAHMNSEDNRPSRRSFFSALAALGTAGVAAARTVLAQTPSNAGGAPVTTPLSDGKTLNGWIDAERSATSFSGADILDLSLLADRLSDTSDPVSVLLNTQLDDAVKTDVAAFSPSTSEADMKALKSELAADLSRLITGGALYDPIVFHDIALRPETQALVAQNPHGAADLAHLNRLLLEDAYPDILAKTVAIGWMIKDGVLSSTGAGRGVLYTANDYSRFRLLFTMRHVSGNPDHPACVLIFCTRPQPGEIPLDALGGIQFQVPLAGHWDYRAGKNNDGDDEFKPVVKAQVDPHQWTRVEILVDAKHGIARMAVAQPPGSAGTEVLYFHDPTAGKAGPIALQMHNAGLFDEYKDIAIEVDPVSDGFSIL
jgi:hypothetical protein